MTYEIRTLTMGGVLDHAILLFKNNFKLMVILVSVVLLPVELVFGIAQEILNPYIQPGQFDPDTALLYPMVFMGVNLIYMLAMLFAVPFTQVAVIHAIAKRYLGEDVEWRACLRVAIRLFLIALVINILVGLAVGLGTLACILPGIYLSCVLMVPVQALVLENANPIDSVSRSWRLLTGMFLEVLVLTFVLGFMAMGTVAAMFVPIPFLGTIISQTLGALFVAFQSVVFTVLYFSARCRHEHLDLDLAADAVAAHANELEPATL